MVNCLCPMQLNPVDPFQSLPSDGFNAHFTGMDFDITTKLRSKVGSMLFLMDAKALHVYVAMKRVFREATILELWNEIVYISAESW
jgi:hypothetical protein